MSVRRDLWLAVGGMDERLLADFNDVDLCLRFEREGLRNLYTPSVRLIHHESATRSERPTDPGEVELMYERWGERLARDPHVSPHFDLADPRPALALKMAALPPGEAA